LTREPSGAWLRVVVVQCFILSCSPYLPLPRSLIVREACREEDQKLFVDVYGESRPGWRSMSRASLSSRVGCM